MTEADGKSSLIVKDLVVQRGGREVLHGISLDLHAGELTALLGANGAGKSSLVMTMAGTLPAKSGSVTIDGKAVLGNTPDSVRRMGIAIVLEGHPVLNNISVIDNLRAAALMHSRREADREVEAAFEVFPELKQRAQMASQNLSGGQKQMVVVAQALICRPKFLLIDELSFGLAPAVVARLGETIKTISARGVGILLIEQFTTLALSLANRVYVMERGDMAFSGSAKDLRENPEILHGAYLASGKAAAGG
ncbi:MAG TPA: ATP-binding cassette domain-containing protein [Stellaceae bacterium]|nr:ATP-binding cassette domain-containing protein [Stellaceae bacterium]